MAPKKAEDARWPNSGTGGGWGAVKSKAKEGTMWGATERFRTPGGGWEQGAFRDEERFAKLVGAFLNLEVENDSAASAAGAAGAADSAGAADAAGAAGAASAPGAPGPPGTASSTGMGGTGGRGGAKIDLAAILALRPAMSKKHRVGEFGSGQLTVPRAMPGTVVPENCTAEGPGLEGAVLKVPGRFTITCRDAEHEPVAPSEAEQFTIDIVGQTKPDHSLIESSDGRLTVHWLPTPDHVHAPECDACACNRWFGFPRPQPSTDSTFGSMASISKGRPSPRKPRPAASIHPGRPLSSVIAC